MYLDHIILMTLVVINLVSFSIMAHDKRKSMQSSNPERTPEGILFFLAGAFGAGGVYLGMITFRHKTKKWYFQLGIPLLIAENLATLYILKELFVQ